MTARLAALLGLVILTACATPTGRAFVAEPLTQEEGQCDACGEYTDPPNAGGVWPDGRLTCSRCLARAVVDQGEAQAILEEARAELEGVLDLELGQTPVRLRLTDQPNLLDLAGELSHPDLRAFTEIVEVLRGDEIESRRFTVHVLRGLPRACLLGIFCHELFHVWQILHGGIRRHADAAFREGAAQYVQLRVLELREEDEWTERLLRNPDPVYGEGLRRFRKLVAARGASAALELGATTDGFPPGY